MKRLLPLVAAIAGIAAIIIALPSYESGQPQGIRITRPQARAIADRAAREVGIPLEKTWPSLVWDQSSILEKELRHHRRRADAWNDPVFGPRLDVYRITYYYRAKEKFPSGGVVLVDGRTGQVTSARLRLRPEDTVPAATEAQLRTRADAFVRSRAFPGAPSPVFESARSTEMRGHTDWVFRYKVPSTFPLKDVVPYLNIAFSGDRFAGWDLSEEYLDGRQYYGESGGDVANVLVMFAAMFGILLILLFIFLRKYHAGEVGVGAASFLFIVAVLLSVVTAFLVRVSEADGTGMGSIDAAATSWATMFLRLMFADIPTAIIVFLAWAVGESYARERWGEHLAAFEAILRRDAWNATVGRSMLRGVLFAPAIAGATFLIGLIPMALGQAWSSTSAGTDGILYLGGPIFALFRSASETIVVGITGLLFLLAWTHRRRMLWAGILAAGALGVISGAIAPPLDPVAMRMLFGFGGMAAAIAVFLRYDLLTATTALFGGTLITRIAPLLSVARGGLAQDLALTMTIPIVVLTAFAIGALLTKREVVYTYEDLAPHVKRIIERERVKAEIDAANRIQAALLPLDAPQLAGASFASHYRAATEIGGDYFDFLEQSTGEIGIAFGDVSGHGLTSGIVMSMAKSALLVQVDYDSSPRAVLDVLNDIVIKTAPKRILMTFFFGLLDPRAQTLRFSSAGHLDPYVFRAATGKLEALSSWGFPLGVRRREPFREHDVSFTSGDRLVLYSDGLIEAVDDDGNPFGFERFEQTIIASGAQSAEEMKKTLLQAVKKFTRNRPPEDDQTLVVVAFEEAQAGMQVREPGMLAAPVSETVH